MSDSEHSTVTYTSISSDYEEPSDVGSLRVVVYGYDGLPMHPPSPDYVPGTERPPSPNYVPGPEHPPSPVYVPYVPEPAYPEFMPPEDDVFPTEEQPLPAVVSPTADSPGYITESDPEEDSEEDDEDPEEDPADYPADRDDEEEEEESSRDDANDKEEDEDEGEDEEELLAIPTPPPSPLTSLSSSLPRIPSPPFPVPSPLSTSPTDAGAPLGYRAAEIRFRTSSPPPLPLSSPLPLPPPIILPRTRASMVKMRATAPSTYILAPQSETLSSETPPSWTPPLLPISIKYISPPLLIHLLTGFVRNVPPMRLRYCLGRGCALLPVLDMRSGSVHLLLLEILEIPDEIVEEIPATDVAELGQRMTDFVTTIRQDTYEIYGRLDDAQDDRSLMSGQLNLLRRDRRSHACTARLMKNEAKASREVWVQSMDASDTTRSEVIALRTTILAQQTKIGDLRAADRKQQAQLTEALTLLKKLKWHQQKEPQGHHQPQQPPPHLSPMPIKALIDQGVVDALAARDADRSQNGDDNHNSGTGSRRTHKRE
ncbi:hypothetical protein Tco_0090736 [Tanacetum coccineum]